MGDRKVVLRRGRRVGWWVEGRSARGSLFMMTWWPSRGLARTVARLVSGAAASRSSTATRPDGSVLGDADAAERAG